MNKVSEWLGDYLLTNPESRNLLDELSDNITQTKELTLPIHELNNKYKVLSDKIRQTPELQGIIIRAPEYISSFLSKKEYSFNELMHGLKENDYEVIHKNGFLDDFLNEMLNNDNVQKIIENKYFKELDNITEQSKKLGLETPLSIKQIAGSERIMTSELQDDYKTRAIELEKKSYNLIIKFLASEGKLKGTAYYPGGWMDYSFCQKGIELVIQDPCQNKEDFSNLEGKIKVIKKIVNTKNTPKEYDTLIMKDSFAGNEPKLQELYKAVIKNLKQNGKVIAWKCGFYTDPNMLKLKEDAINPLLKRIAEGNEFEFYDPIHRSLNFKVWEKA